jgi:hypothetical protein
VLHRGVSCHSPFPKALRPEVRCIPFWQSPQ